MSEFDAQLITPVWGTRAIVDCCILKVGLRTVPPEVAECCPEPCQDSGQPLFHISSHHVSSLHCDHSVVFGSGGTYPKLCLDPAPNPFGASVSRTPVSTFLPTGEVSQQVTKVKGLSWYPSDWFDRHLYSRTCI